MERAFRVGARGQSSPGTDSRSGNLFYVEPFSLKTRVEAINDSAAIRPCRRLPSGRESSLQPLETFAPSGVSGEENILRIREAKFHERRKNPPQLFIATTKLFETLSLASVEGG